MSENIDPIQSINDAAIDPAGKLIVFTINTASGKNLRTACSAADFGKIPFWLLDLGQQAFHKWSEAERSAAAAPPRQIQGFGLTAFSLDLRDNQASGRVGLSINLGFAHLPVSIPRRSLEAFVQHATKLLAGSGAKDN
ncbi:hypothetical protein [Bradyrhizobium sp. 62]|uniref:hypothetical protein n=1 Tax=Bradyrhizobium sp. 62 TaxID=1043588 RepID=UPI001FF87573|nr:hypothetical protein [Bradyrhizobium sp. 62]MCK1367600.1 hypothetical protein [Bradyrhizobium sp. 62]